LHWLLHSEARKKDLGSLCDSASERNSMNKGKISNMIHCINYQMVVTSTSHE
jgi:hypothetical protein